ncbi:putative cytochrome C [Neisseria meningitidis]|nr:putative cytochrome C [Neisseria meningitidis]
MNAFDNGGGSVTEKDVKQAKNKKKLNRQNAV